MPFSDKCSVAIPILVVLLVMPASACKKSDANRISASGVFEAIEVNVGSKMPGQLKSVNFEEGQEVKTGALLAEVDCADLKFQISSADANLDMARSKSELVVKGARSEDINQAVAGNEQASAGLELAKADFNRMKNLYESGAVPRKMFDDSEARLRISQAQMESASEMLRKIRKISRVEEVSMAKSGVEAAVAALDLMKKKLADCNIEAPIDGWVLRKVFEKGELVGPSSVIAVLSDLRRLKAVVYLPEADVFRIKLGEKVKIMTDGFKDKSFDGTVSYISPRAEFTPKNVQTKDERVKLMFSVKILVDNPELILKPGLPMDVEFTTNAK